MEKDELLDIWKKGNEKLFENQKINKIMITKYLNEKTLKTSRYFNFNIIFYWFIQLVNIILLSMNLVGYLKNTTIFWVLIPQLIISLGILLYGIIIYYKFREINNYSDTLLNMINKQLKYFKTNYEIWLFITSLSVLILLFNVNIMVDYDGGRYPINNKLLYIGTNIFVFLFIYGTQKAASFVKLKALKAYMTDLQNGILDKSIEIEKNKKKYVWIGVVLVLILVAFLVFGIIKFIQF